MLLLKNFTLSKVKELDSLIAPQKRVMLEMAEMIIPGLRRTLVAVQLTLVAL